VLGRGGGCADREVPGLGLSLRCEDAGNMDRLGTGNSMLWNEWNCTRDDKHVIFSGSDRASERGATLTSPICTDPPSSSVFASHDASH